MDDTLVTAVKQWPTPQGVKDVQKFLGLAGYYRKFIKNYAHIARPISDLIRYHKFKWEKEQKDAFEQLKGALLSAPVLALPKIGKPFVLTTDASRYAVGVTLEQEGHPVAYMSHRLSDAETNWHTGDQELLAFLIALQKWDVYLRGVTFKLNTDHQPIQYLQSKPRLSPRQQRWLDVFQQYDFNISHLKGKDNVAADALSRRSDLELKRISRLVPDFRKKIKDAQDKDPFSQKMVQKIEDPSVEAEPIIEKKFRTFHVNDGILTWTPAGQMRSYVPNVEELRKEIIREFHKDAHFGVAKVYSRAAACVYWENMYRDTQKWVAGCRTCLANKVERNKSSGLLQPHDIPKRCWEHITADFVTEFPVSERGHDTVLVVVDKLSKRVILIPMTKTATAEEVAHLFEAHVFSKFVVPDKLTSDRDGKFTSKYWETIMRSNAVKMNMATKDHPETDGQSERSIQTLIRILRPTIQKEPEQWDRFLPLMEFEMNAAKQESTKLSPFEIYWGRIPTRPLTRSFQNTTETSDSAKDFVERQELFVKVARDHLFAAREAQRYFADRNRKDRNF